MDAWKQSIAEVNTTIQRQVQQVLIEGNDYDDDNWDDYIESCADDDYGLGSAYGFLFEVEPNYVEMDEREDVW